MDLLKGLSIDKIQNLAEDAINQVKPKTDVEARVYEVLSHKNWGASSSIQNQIARDTFDYEKFAIITRIMWDAVETNRPAAWRIIFKGLSLVEHLVKNGSERCVDDARNHAHVLRALHQFNYYEGTIDRGVGVREKSKQLVEMLGDNERIREERQKARKLREKLGASTMTASSTGTGGYSGEDGWNSGGGGGYGESGIDSGGFGGRDPYSGGGARGRYDDSDGQRGGHASSSAAPTFATIPSKKKPGMKKKKKKAAEPEAAPAPAPEVDLFSFDDPSPAPAPPPAAAASDDDFGDFAGASGGADFSGFESAPAPAPSGTSDLFGGDPFSSSSNQGPVQPGPFASSSTQQQSGQMNGMADMFGSMNMGGNNNMMSGNSNIVGGNGNMMGGGNGNMMGGGNGNMMGGNNGNIMGGGNNKMMGGNNNIMGGSNVMGGNRNVMGGGSSFGASSTPAPAPASVNNEFDDDDFGDFAGASNSGGKGGQKSSSGSAKSSDPFGSLVSLDGLSKNTKGEDKLSQPVVINEAAQQYMQDKQQGLGASQPQNSSKSVAMSFAGIDGLQKQSGGMNSMGMGMGGGMGMSSPAPSGSMNSSVMGSSSAGNAGLIGSLDPSMMNQQRQQSQQQQQQQQGGMDSQQQGGMMNQQQMMQQMQQMMGGNSNQQMTPQQQQQLMQQMQMMMQMQRGNQGMSGGYMGGQGGGAGW